MEPTKSRSNDRKMVSIRIDWIKQNDFVMNMKLSIFISLSCLLTMASVRESHEKQETSARKAFAKASLSESSENSIRSALHLIEKSVNKDGVKYSKLETNANIERMKHLFVDHFNGPRNELLNNTNGKQKARHKILEVFKSTRMQVFEQLFSFTLNGRHRQGVNVIAVLEGNLESDEKALIVVAAHYDTHGEGGGVDDNASGVVALLELVQLFDARPEVFINTIVFVALDWSYPDNKGSKSFVNHFLIDTYLLGKKYHFIGAFILDMILNFDTSTSSQDELLFGDTAVQDKFKAYNFQALNDIRSNGRRGDFIAIFARTEGNLFIQEVSLSNVFARFCRKVSEETKNKFKVYNIWTPYSSERPSGSRVNSAVNSSSLYPNFINSDQITFWFHGHEKYKHPLTATLISDTMDLRGVQKRCFRKGCDDLNQVRGKEGIGSHENVRFLKHNVEALQHALRQVGHSQALDTRVGLKLLALTLISLALVFVVGVITLVIDFKTRKTNRTESEVKAIDTSN